MPKILTPSERKKHFRKKRKTKLTEQDVKQIRNLRKRGEKQQKIAKKFHISPGYVSRIISQDVWVHV